MQNYLLPEKYINMINGECKLLTIMKVDEDMLRVDCIHYVIRTRVCSCRIITLLYERNISKLWKVQSGNEDDTMHKRTA